MFKTLKNQDGHITAVCFILLLLVMATTFAIAKFQSYRWKTDIQDKIEEKISPVRNAISKILESGGKFSDNEQIAKSNIRFVSIEPEGTIKVNLAFVDKDLKDVSIDIIPILEGNILSWVCKTDNIVETSYEYSLLPKVCIDESLTWTDKPNNWWWVGYLIIGIGSVVGVYLSYLL